MLSRVYSAAVQGIDGYPVTVEVDFRDGLPAFTIVGLPDAGVRESRERVLAAIKNSGYSFEPLRITINLAPANIKKEGSSFDFPIAIGILAATGHLPLDAMDKLAFLGELGLNGKLRPVRGVLPCTMGLKEKNFDALLLPKANAKEAGIVEGIKIYPVETLKEAVNFLNGDQSLASFTVNRRDVFKHSKKYPVDFSDVKGQVFAKRALEVAAAGGHNILMMGPPGSGKTLLARRLPTILPEMEFEEALETTKIHSVAGYLKNGQSLIATRPYRSPHHQVSGVAMVGGGSNPRPGEVSLAHRGVLFLDEFPEFGRDVLEGLRQPLEDRYVTVVRIANAVRYPADFLLVAAANPCPCGYHRSTLRSCTCSTHAVEKYSAKLSGPLMDRIDLHVEVPALKIDEITGDLKASEPSALIRERVNKARLAQRQRLHPVGLVENAQMSVRMLKQFCPLDQEGKNLIKDAIKKLGLSARAYDRILRVSRTLADLSGSEKIQSPHLMEAIGFRVLDRKEEPVMKGA